MAKPHRQSAETQNIPIVGVNKLLFDLSSFPSGLRVRALFAFAVNVIVAVVVVQLTWSAAHSQLQLAQSTQGKSRWAHSLCVSLSLFSPHLLRNISPETRTIFSQYNQMPTHEEEEEEERKTCCRRNPHLISLQCRPTAACVLHWWPPHRTQPIDVVTRFQCASEYVYLYIIYSVSYKSTSQMNP